MKTWNKQIAGGTVQFSRAENDEDLKKLTDLAGVTLDRFDTVGVFTEAPKEVVV